MAALFFSTKAKEATKKEATKQKKASNNLIVLYLLTYRILNQFIESMYP